MGPQLSFDLPARPALGRDDFFVSPGNAMAVAMIERPATGKLVLHGPQGAGKTHLAHVWAERTGAVIRAARDLDDADLLELANSAVVVEDVPRIASDRNAQEVLFHLHNLVLAQGNPLLLTGRGAPSHWGLTLPDLQSRIDGTTAVALALPDDALLAAVLAKLFHDRQITPRAGVIPYLVAHMDRSFAEAARIVAQLDAAALAERRNLTRKLAERVLGQKHRNPD
jgi:chromosomal replication initiation ATPase DnaA